MSLKNTANEIQVKVLNTKDLSESLLADVISLSMKNSKHITVDYLKKRVTKYSLISCAFADDVLVGFGFADLRKFRLGLVKNIPLVHFGLTIVDKSWRKNRVSLKICKAIANRAQIEFGKKILLTGFFVSAKCSSPISFYRLQQETLGVGLPKLKNNGTLGLLSKLPLAKKLCQNVSTALDMSPIHDFIIRDANNGDELQWHKETYSTKSKYEEKVVHFFEKNIFPKNELLLLSYAHPLIISIYDKKLQYSL